MGGARIAQDAGQLRSPIAIEHHSKNALGAFFKWGQGLRNGKHCHLSRLRPVRLEA